MLLLLLPLLADPVCLPLEIPAAPKPSMEGQSDSALKTDYPPSRAASRPPRWDQVEQGSGR